MKISLKRIKIIFCKEMTEIFRNVSLFFILIVFPAVVYPFVISYIGETAQKEQNKLDMSISRIYLRNDAKVPYVEEYFLEDDKITLVETPNSKIGKDCDLTVKFEKSPDLFKTEYENYSVKVTYDSTSKKSTKALERAELILKDITKETLYSRIEEKQIDIEILSPFSIGKINLASKHDIVSDMLADVLPFMIIIFIMSGALQIAVDITAGEKDRKTIQTLLMSCVLNGEIAVAKILVVASSALICCFSNFLSICLAVRFAPSSFSYIQYLSFPVSALFTCIASLLPLILFIAALLVLIGIAAKNQVEASLYSMPVLMFGMLALISSSASSAESFNFLSCLIPVYNSAVSIKLIMTSSSGSLYIAASILSNLVYSFFIVFLCVKAFQNENVVFYGVSGLLHFKKSRRL